MNKIATPQDLQAEIHSIAASIATSETVERSVIAAKLVELADRVVGRTAADTPQSVSKMLLDTANDIYDGRGATRKLQHLLGEAKRSQPLGEGPFAGADDNLLDRVRTAQVKLEAWDLAGGFAASAMEALARDLKGLRRA